MRKVTIFQMSQNRSVSSKRPLSNKTLRDIHFNRNEVKEREIKTSNADEIYYAQNLNDSFGAGIYMQEALMNELANRNNKQASNPVSKSASKPVASAMRQNCQIDAISQLENIYSSFGSRSQVPRQVPCQVPCQAPRQVPCQVPRQVPRQVPCQARHPVISVQPNAVHQVRPNAIQASRPSQRPDNKGFSDAEISKALQESLFLECETQNAKKKKDMIKMDHNFALGEQYAEDTTLARFLQENQ